MFFEKTGYASTRVVKDKVLVSDKKMSVYLKFMDSTSSVGVPLISTYSLDMGLSPFPNFWSGVYALRKEQ